MTHLVRRYTAVVTPRNVRGSDVVVSYCPQTDNVLITRVLSCQVDKSGLRSEDLIRILGLNRKLEYSHFLKNNNVHKAHKGLRGALLVLNYRIGLIVATMGTHIMFQTLLPKKRSDEVIVVDLMDGYEQNYGFFLQQIHGDLVGRMTSQCAYFCNTYPYTINGSLYMDPKGPHFFVHKNLSTMPPFIRQKFESIADNLSYRGGGTGGSYVKRRRVSRYAEVLYVMDSPNRTNAMSCMDCFFVPVGDPCSNMSCPWNPNEELYHLQEFVILTPHQAKSLSKIPKTTKEAWNVRVRFLEAIDDMGNPTVTLLVPSVHWSLNIVIVEDHLFDNLELKHACSPRSHITNFNGVRMVFSYAEKCSFSKTGTLVSTWVHGDPLVSRTRVTYEYVEQYIVTYGPGYGSRPRSSCLDSLNSYRDKRFNARVHPSPFVFEADISQHQYYSSDKQKYCLLQMKLESILHSLTNDATFVAEQANPKVVRVTAGLSTKLIATSGRSLFSFCNGLHVDAGDCISDTARRKLFPDGELDNPHSGFGKVSFPTTCGYQHVWKSSHEKTKYVVIQHFVMPSMGLGVVLNDSVCHHFMGGAFPHCTGVCVLSSREDDHVLCTNADVAFRLFAWGNSANSKTYKGNVGSENTLGNHRDVQAKNRANGRPSKDDVPHQRKK